MNYAAQHALVFCRRGLRDPEEGRKSDDCIQHYLSESEVHASLVSRRRSQNPPSLAAVALSPLVTDRVLPVPGMVLLVAAAHVLERHLGIDLRRLNAFVTQELFDGH